MSGGIVYLPNGTVISMGDLCAIGCAVVAVLLLGIILVLKWQDRREERKWQERNTVEREATVRMAAELLDAMEHSTIPQRRTVSARMEEGYEDTEVYRQVDHMVERRPRYAAKRMQQWLQGEEYDP